MEIRFTARELDVMSALWDRGPSTVNEVRDALVDDLAYTTVQTILRILEDKGYVGHQTEGRTHRYEALVEQQAAGRSALDRVKARLFDGSAEMVLTRLMDDDDVSAEELRRMRDLLSERLGEGGGA